MGAYADLLPDSSDSANTSSSVARSSGNQRVDAFVEQYRPIAERVAEQTGNDPELYLAKWGLETGWGKSIIPGTNNLGNIKDFSGSGVSAKDNATGSVDRYRQYKDANQFADDYASLLNRRYKNALNVGSDMDTFATELKRAGYAEDPNYVSKLKSAYNMLGGSAAQSDASQPSPNARGEYEPRTDYSAALRQFDKVPNDTYEANRLASTPKGMSISKEISAAIDSYQANLWSIPAAMGSEYALNAMLENKSAAEQQWADSGAPQSFSEMEFGKNFGQYFAHMAIQSAPYMLEFIASGFGVGSLAKGALANTAKGVAEKAAIEAAKQGATKEAAKKAGEVAAKEFMGTVYTASGVAGSYPSAVGDVLSNQYEQSGKFNLPAAAALGVPYAALNAAGAEGMLTRGLARGLPKTSLTAKGAAGFAGRAALTGAEAGLMEGSTETGQEVMNQLGRMAVDPDAKIDDKRALEAYKESFIAGGLLGGVPGAVAGGFRKPEDAKLQPPAPVANSPLSSAVNTAQHVEKQRQQAAVDDHLEQILGMIAQRDDLTERIAGLQNMIDRADPSSEDGQRIRAMQSDMQMRRDSLVAQLDAAKAFYGGDQTANVGPTNDPLILGNEQMSRIYQVTQNLLNDPASLDPESRSGLLKGFSVMRNRTLPEATRIDAAISLIATMDDMAARRAAAASGRADEREWNAFASDEAARDGEASRVAPNQQQGVVTQSAPALATDERARKAAAAEYEAAYQDLVKAEQLGVSDQELMQRQIAMRNAENRLQEINEAIEANRAKETAEKRGALLDRVLASNPGNPNRAFDRALRLEGFRDATFTKEEKEKIARFNELRSIQEDGVFSAPNEAGAFGIREKRPSAVAGRYQHIADMLSSGWQLVNKHQLTGPNGEVYNLKGAGEAQFVRNKLNQKAGNGNQSPRDGSQGGTDQGDFGVGGAGANGPVPQGGGNGSGQANAIPDTDAPAGAVSEAEATGAGNQPNNSLARSRLTALEDQRIAKYADELRSMAPDSGWAEEGGRLLIAPDGTKSRTKWIPRAEWFIAGMLNSPQESVAAVEKAISGQPMRKTEKLHVQGMMDFLDMQYGIDGESHAEQLATLSDIAYEGESADAQNIIDTLGDVDLESNGAWADEVESMRALGFTEEEINEITRRKQGAFGAIGEEAAGVPAGETQTAIPEGDGNGNGQAEGQEGFSLNQQTNTEAAAQFAQQQAGESTEITKEQADKERDAVPFSMQQETQPKPQGRQTGLFTADGRVSSEAKPSSQKTAAEKAKETRQRRQDAIAVLGEGWSAKDGVDGAKDIYKKRVGVLEVSVMPERTTDGNFTIGTYNHKTKMGSTAFANTLEEAAKIANQKIEQSQQKTDSAKKGQEQAAPASQPENDKPAYADDAELQDALSHLGDVLGDVFGAKLNITGKQYGASDLLPAMSKVIELLIKKGFKSFRESVGAATNAMRGNANTKGFVDQITPRQWKAAYNSVAEFHEGTESEEDVAKYSAEQIQKIISSQEDINRVDDEIKKAWADISRVVSAGTDKSRNGNKEFATYKKLGDSEAKIIEKKTGIKDIAGYQHQIDESAVRHIFKKHGNEESESKRGQVAITAEDFKRLPEITDPLLADSVDRGEAQEDGTQTIIYRKKFDDTLYVVEEVRTGRQYLALKTMWKVRSAQRATDESGFAHTSETLGSQPSTGNENISQDNALRNSIKAAEQATNHDATPGQKEAGNYAKGKFAWQGLTIAVETAKGEDRTDKETNGDKWRVTMPATYGYFLGSEGADGDHVDVFMGDKPESQRVYVVNQTKPGSTEFDEHKIMLGYESEGAAIGDYLLSFSDTFGASVLGSVSGPYAIDDFKHMLESNRFSRAKPISDRLAYVNPRVEEKPVEQQPPGVKTNGTKEKAAAERLAQLLDKIDQVRIDRNTPEGSAKGIVRSVIEELRKERTAVSVVELLETASQRLLRQHAPFSEVIDQVVESLRSDASPDNKGDIKQAGVSLDKFGLTVRRSQTKNGTPTWEVSGNTRDHVAVLRNAGGKWYGPKKVWSFYSEESPESKILAALGAMPEPAEVSLSEIEVERKSEGTGRIKTYKQRADEALSEIDERMGLGKQLLECLNS